MKVEYYCHTCGQTICQLKNGKWKHLKAADHKHKIVSRRLAGDKTFEGVYPGIFAMTKGAALDGEIARKIKAMVKEKID